MLRYAVQRKLKVVKGVAEQLPYPDGQFDFAVFITSLCFIDDPEKALKEAHRIIKNNGDLVIALIDKESPLGKSLEFKQNVSKFYWYAKFYSVSDVISMLENSHFEIIEIIQTLTEMNSNIPENPRKGYGKGGFVVIKGKRR
jgi:ubiquinone/menaquinone biosynthesis C-methylase UbiE